MLVGMDEQSVRPSEVDSFPPKVRFSHAISALKSILFNVDVPLMFRTFVLTHPWDPTRTKPFFFSTHPSRNNFHFFLFHSAVAWVGGKRKRFCSRRIPWVGLKIYPPHVFKKKVIKPGLRAVFMAVLLESYKCVAQ
jgi:hypothetical protein